MVELFRQRAQDGALDKPTLLECLHDVLPEDVLEEDRMQLNLSFDMLFKYFDANGDGIVDAQEFLTAMATLCFSSLEEKLRLVFDMYDIDHDGALNRQEVQQQMQSIALAFFALNPKSAELNLSPTQMAQAARRVAEQATDQCFEVADTNEDGIIDFEEFCHWYEVSPKTSSLSWLKLFDRIQI
eukprot:TRINITY_DN699_c0_g1_i1.p1 TRINITY_DN699_c0_g1~~TRINITY_DN699_c0_g1_i1.p1  ORF type:complete len:184 (+),score=56.56 TRINITY_DN699_c0_g1_i1:75-626(+)